MIREVAVGNAVFGGGRPLVLIAGPCVIEEESLTLRIAEQLRRVTADLGIGLVFKASFDKANRTSVTSFRGYGMKEGLRILARVKGEFGVPVVSDIQSVGPAHSSAMLMSSSSKAPSIHRVRPA